MSKANPTWDEKDVLAATDALKSEADKFEATLRAAGKNVPPRPAMAASALDNFDKMSAHMAQLRALISISVSMVTANALNAEAVSAAGGWNPDAQIAAAKQRANGSDDDKPDNKPAGNCGECSGTGRCKTCNGSGKKSGSSESCADCEGDGRCPECNGNGSTEKEEAGQDAKAAWNPDAALLGACGAKSITDLVAKGPTRFAQGD